MGKLRLRHVAAAVALVMVAAACGSSDDSSTTIADESAVAPDEETPAANPAPASGNLTAADGWELTSLGEGIKPALAVNANGQPAVAYLTENLAGGIFYSAASNGWTTTTIAEGYFYGPIDVAFDPGGAANIVYHDHQAPTFQPDQGDLVLAIDNGDGWAFSASDDDGHDGWDSTITFGPNGELWAAGIEPIDFRSEEGVEFYEFDGSSWAVESIGGPPITYQFNVSLAASANGEPVLTYYDDNNDQLHIATRTADGWTDEAITEPGGGGMFSSLVIDDGGTRHVTFYAATGANRGTVHYAADDGSGWATDTLAELDDVQVAMTGARRFTSLQLDADGSPVVAFTDRSAVWVATLAGDGWEISEVLTPGANPLGQQVQLVVDGSTWHLATFEATSVSPLEGDILYLSRTT